ncbi:hypothetical protein ACFE04_008980 [Oxalis oulophora]
MLGLHNMFLISQQQQQPQPPSTLQQNQQNINNNIHQGYTANPCNLNNKSHNELNLIKQDTLFGVCKDCGNRAKKECEFRRCRTCCKTRGYDCFTHVKSTWIPVSTRREKRGGDGGSSGGSSCGGGGGGGKRQRLDYTCTNSSNDAKAFNFESNAYHQDAGFKKSLPSKVFAPAAFRCIRVTAINNGEAEVAYQATVNISGHVFKGFLYNKGVDEKSLFPKVPLESGKSKTSRDSTSPIVNPRDTFAASNDRR